MGGGGDNGVGSEDEILTLYPPKFLSPGGKAAARAATAAAIKES